jgi:hypothetical protein
MLMMKEAITTTQISNWCIERSREGFKIYFENFTRAFRCIGRGCSMKCFSFIMREYTTTAMSNATQPPCNSNFQCNPVSFKKLFWNFSKLFFQETLVNIFSKKFLKTIH